jgi:ribosomal protein L40E
VNPGNHELTYLNATVYNTGAVSAHDVTADFLDSYEGGSEFLGTGSVDFVPVDGSGVISIQWNAKVPLDPKSHNISVVVDPLNLVPELDETTVTGYTTVYVQNLPDVYVLSADTEILTVPTEAVVNTAVELRANVHNQGDLTTGDVAVDFYDVPDGMSRTLIASDIVSGIAWNTFAIASVTWTPTVTGSHTIWVYVNPEVLGVRAFDEIDYTNNEASVIKTVLTPPNLVVSNLQFDPTGAVPGGDDLTITATLRNTQLAPVTFVNVALYVGAPTGTPVMNYNVLERLAENGATTITFVYTTPVVTASTDITFYVVANPSNLQPLELSYADNTVFGTITVLDMRPDLVVTPSSITVFSGTQDVTSSMYGRTVTVVVNVTNIGGRPAYDFSIRVGIRNESFTGGGSYNHTFIDELFNISALPLNNTVSASFEWTVSLTVWADYQIWAYVDPWGNVSEPIEANNWAVTPFTIVSLDAEVQIIVEKTEYTAGDEVYITATISYRGTSVAVPDVPFVIFRLVDKDGVAVEGSDTVEVNSTHEGVVIQTLTVPSDIASGSYNIVAVVFNQTYTSASPATLQISSQVSGGLFPWWVWIVIIAVVGAAIAGFTVYTYFYGLGKYVECGECGAFIPAASKRCPKCGVEFEAGTMKCSECGAWIPATSTECPNCGVKFVGEVEEDADYLERMRKQYDEMVSKYRELARPELGKKFSDKAFDEWWRRQPGYITFDDWLAKEEEKKKEGPVPCPVCGTLNPKEATVCHKCGTVFGAPPKRGPPGGAPPAAVPREAEGQAEAPSVTEAAAVPGAAPRMVIRRPIEKKVVPKKIIRTPTGQVIEEEPKEDNNQ